jgi:antitoxin ParD1/3/4
MAQNQNTSISLGEHFSNFITTSVQKGRYSSASEVVRAGLRLLEEHEAKLTALGHALEEGLTSGVPEAFDPEAFFQQMREKHGAKA